MPHLARNAPSSLLDRLDQIRRKLGDVFTQSQQGEVLAFGLEHDVERPHTGGSGCAQQVDERKAVNKIAMLNRQQAPEVIFCRPLM